MKKIIFSAGLLTFLSLCGHAQTAQPAQPVQPVKTEEVNPDGTMKTTPTPVAQDKSKKSDKSRMAITEKGVPVTKSKTTGNPPADQAPASTTKKEEKPAEKK